MEYQTSVLFATTKAFDITLKCSVSLVLGTRIESRDACFVSALVEPNMISETLWNGRRMSGQLRAYMRGSVKRFV